MMFIYAMMLWVNIDHVLLKEPIMLIELYLYYILNGFKWLYKHHIIENPVKYQPEKISVRYMSFLFCCTLTLSLSIFSERDTHLQPDQNAWAQVRSYRLFIFVEKTGSSEKNFLFIINYTLILLSYIMRIAMLPIQIPSLVVCSCLHRAIYSNMFLKSHKLRAAEKTPSFHFI